MAQVSRKKHPPLNLLQHLNQPLNLHHLLVVRLWLVMKLVVGKLHVDLHVTNDRLRAIIKPLFCHFR
jgi:hypothetical protein